MINARRMRHLITIQSKDATQDEDGHFTDYSTVIESVRCEITPMSGREWSGRAPDVTVDTRIICRFRPDVEPNQRAIRLINEGDSPERYEVYDIAAVLPDPDSGRQWMTLMCTRRDTEGFARGDAP